MSIIIYLFLLVFLLILFVIFTAIGLTFKLNVLGLEERKEFGGTFTIKWLLFSYTFSFEEPKAKESCFEEPYTSKPEKEVIKERGNWRDKKEFEQSEYRAEDISQTESKISAEKGREIGEKTPEEREKKLAIAESEEKTGVNEGVETKERADTEERAGIKEGVETRERTEIKVKDEKKEKTSLIDRIKGKKRIKKEDQVEPEKGMTTREILYWGFKAFTSLRKPVLRLFSDMLHGIKIKRLDSRVTFGLADPADTGMLCGFVHAVVGFIYGRCKHCSFSVNPVFMMKYMLDFRGDAEIRVKLYSMILPFFRFIFNRSTLSFTYSVAKELFRRKWESEWEPKWKSKWKPKWKSNS